MSIYKMYQFEEWIIAQDGVKDAKALINNKGDIIVYYLTNKPVDRNLLQKNILKEVGPCTIIENDFFPFKDGKIDEAVLSKTPILDNEYIKEYYNQNLGIHLSNISLKRKYNLSSNNTQLEMQKNQTKKTTTKKAILNNGELQNYQFKTSSFNELLLSRKDSVNGLHLINSEGTESFLPYSKLIADALAISEQIKSQKIKSGEVVILLISDFNEYFTTLWACFFAGVIPTTIAVPVVFEDANPIADKIKQVVEDNNFRKIITDQDPDLIINFLARDVQVITTIELQVKKNMDDTIQMVSNIQDHEIQFIQLSSGSTGIPKAIPIYGENLLFYLNSSAELNNYHENDVILNWLPYDHVVPMLTCHLKASGSGANQVIVSSEFVLSSPLRWLELIEKYKVTFSWAPNFAFKLVSDSLIENPTSHYDLASIKKLMNAGEQISISVISEFVNLTKNMGLDFSQIQPAYGMAELCTAITINNNFYKKDYASPADLSFDDSAERDIPCVNVGQIIKGDEIRVINDKGELQLGGLLGAIEVRGKTVLPSYFGNKEINKEAFTKDGWFKTGDIGFIDNDNLYIAGREKESIIINACHYFCQEFEDALKNNIAWLIPTDIVAVGIYYPEEGTELLTIFFSKDPSFNIDKNNAVSQIAKVISNKFKIAASNIVELPKGEVLKTSSGKIRRAVMRANFISGKYNQYTILQPEQKNSSKLPIIYKKIWIDKNISHLPDTYDTTKNTFIDFVILSDNKQFIDNLTNAISKFQLAEVYAIEIPHIALSAMQVIDQKLHIFQEHPQKKLVVILRLNDIEDLPNKFSLVVFIANQLNQLNKKTTFIIVSNIAYKSSYHNSDDFLQGLVPTINSELPNLLCKQLSFTNIPDDYPLILIKESLALNNDQIINYDFNKRNILGLSYNLISPNLEKDKRLTHNGLYLITGGLGRVGVAVCEYLIKNYNAKLVIVGRADIEKLVTEKSKKSNFDKLLSLAKGEVIYLKSDLSKEEEVSQIIAKATKYFQQELCGVFHLAGQIEERFLNRINIENIKDNFLAKVNGTCNIGTALVNLANKYNKEIVFVVFSSINSFFGGYGYGLYSAANSFMEEYISNLRKHNILSYSLGWSAWDVQGMNSVSSRELLANKGYLILSSSQACGFISILNMVPPATYYIGLDITKPPIASVLSNNTNIIPKYEINIYDKTLSSEMKFAIEKLVLKDKLNHIINCKINFVESEISDTPTDREKKLIEILSNLLKISGIKPKDNFFELGGDSILSIQFSLRAKKLGINLTVGDIVTCTNIKELATKTETMECNATSEQSQQITDITLTPIQLWFFERKFTNQNYWNQPQLLVASSKIDIAILSQAIDIIKEKYHILNSQFKIKDGLWKQSLIKHPVPQIQQIKVHSFYDSRFIIECEKLQSSLDIEGQLWAIGLFEDNNNQQRLLITIHHLIIDGVSWRILLDDLNQIYMNLLKNQSVLLSERKISRWPTSMKLLTENNYFANEVSYWESIAANNTLPKMAINIKENIVANINSIQVTLCKEKTNCFIRNSLFSLESIIITVCMVSLASEFYKNNQALMFIEGHGRETMNKANFEEPSGDIGWFTSLFPFYENFSNLNLIDSLYKVVNNLRSIPHKGAGFMWLKYYGAKEIKEKFKRIFSPTPYITFNYLGIWDYSKKNFFRKSSDLIGFSFDPVNERSELLYFSSIVIEGELRLTIRYSNKTIDDEIIKALIVSIESKFSQIYDFLKTKDEEINAR